MYTLTYTEVGTRLRYHTKESTSLTELQVHVLRAKTFGLVTEYIISDEKGIVVDSEIINISNAQTVDTRGLP